jgi:hypothetical protein
MGVLQSSLRNLADFKVFSESTTSVNAHMKLEIEAKSKRIYTGLTVKIDQFIFQPQTVKYLTLPIQTVLLTRRHLNHQKRWLPTIGSHLRII